MSLRNNIVSFLNTNLRLKAILRGGLYTGVEISRQNTPSAFDSNGEIRVCGLVALETEVPYGPHEHAMRHFFTVTVWQRNGYDQIDRALSEVYDTLHGSKVGLNPAWTVLHVEDSPDLEDPGLRVPMRYSRYQLIYRVRSTG